MNPNLRQLWLDLKRSPGVLITLVVVVGVIIYYVYTQNNSTTNTNNAQPAYEIDQISVTPPANLSTGTTTTQGPVPVHDNPIVTHEPGSTFTGPTGVKHYVTKGGESLSQIASKLGLASWNSIYSIPENKANGWLPNGLTATKAAAYQPPANIPLVY